MPPIRSRYADDPQDSRRRADLDLLRAMVTIADKSLSTERLHNFVRVAAGVLDFAMGLPRDTDEASSTEERG